MSPLEAVGLVSGIASIAGLIYGLYYGRASLRAKLLAYEITPPEPLAKVLQPEEGHHLSILYSRGEGPAERVDAAYIQFIRFANFGREPIRGHDIAPANPLRVEVSGARTLDISLISSRRAACVISSKPALLTPEGTYDANITFDFLDHEDGGLLRIMTADEIGSVRLTGDIIGMPGGIKKSDEIRPHTILDALGCLLGVLIQLAALVGTPFLFRWATGGWAHLWVMVLPVVALVLPGSVAAVVATTIWPESAMPFPKELTFPDFHSSRRSVLTDTRIRVHGDERRP